MSPALQHLFPPYRLDSENGQLWRDDHAIALRRKTFEVLCYLIEHPGSLVTKDALLDAVWAEVSVSDTMPAISVTELRRALGDDARRPRFIETVQRRGYRFIAKVVTATALPERGAKAPPPSLPARPVPIVVGREAELGATRAWYSDALGGQRRIVFISGEPGIGKTTFLRTFLASLAGDQVRIARGQCIEQYGAGEPYMPVLNALNRLAREPGGEQVVEVLRKFAPSWLAQLPSLMNDAERERLPGTAHGVTQQRMLREMTETLEALSAEVPLILALEDLHWSDFSTLELIAVVSRRTEPARLMVIGTFRPVTTLPTEHPLRVVKTELDLHHHCEELRLKLLSEQDVGAYLERRFSDDHEQSFKSAACTIYRHTEGNPLFMVNVVDDLVESGSLLNALTVEPPRTIRQMIEHNLMRLHPEEQQILEAASIVGSEFSAAAVAAALERAVADTETLCARLARYEQFVNASGTATWPDGTIASNFRFQHALYKDVLYDRVPAGLRVELHRRIADRLQFAWGDRAREIAAELAHQFARADEKDKAIQYFQMAGDEAVRRSANREAIAQFEAALRILESLPASADRDRQELRLRVSLRDPLMATDSYTSKQVKRLCDRVRELCFGLGDSTDVFGALAGLTSIHFNLGEVKTSLDLAEQMLRIAENSQKRTLLLWANYAIGFSLHGLGENLGARYRLEKSLDLYDRRRAGSYGFVQDPGPTALLLLAHVVYDLGYPDIALRNLDDGLQMARELAHPFTLAWVLSSCAYIRLRRGELKIATKLFNEGVGIRKKYSFTLEDTGIADGGLRVASGDIENGIDKLRDGIATHRTLYEYGLGLLAEALGMVGCVHEGLELTEEAINRSVEKRRNLAWFYRLKGDLLLKLGAKDQTEHCYKESISITRSQSGKSEELVTTTHLAQLLKSQGRRDEARRMLAEIYNWFTEGFDTSLLKEAKALLNELDS